MHILENSHRRIAGLLAGAAMLSMALPAAAANAPATAPTPAAADQVTKHCVFTNRTPAPGAITGQHNVIIAVNIACNQPVGPVSVFLDGVRKTTEGLGRDAFHVNEFFTQPFLTAGNHRVTVFVQGDGFTSWVFDPPAHGAHHVVHHARKVLRHH